MKLILNLLGLIGALLIVGLIISFIVVVINSAVVNAQESRAEKIKGKIIIQSVDYTLGNSPSATVHVLNTDRSSHEICFAASMIANPWNDNPNVSDWSAVNEPSHEDCQKYLPNVPQSTKLVFDGWPAPEVTDPNYKLLNVCVYALEIDGILSTSNNDKGLIYDWNLNPSMSCSYLDY